LDVEVDTARIFYYWILKIQMYGAEGGTRTPTGLLPLRPERSASTSSTTSARGT
jgi:hypothetical protein